MNCSQARNLFDAYLDGELTGSLATEFGAHRLGCSACRRELALLEVAGHVIASDTATPLLSDEFTDRLLACADGNRTSQRRWRRAVLYIGSPLAAAACLVFALTFLHEPPAPPADPSSPSTMVLDSGDRVDSPEELLEHVEAALIHNPDNEELQRVADALRANWREIVAGAGDGKFLLENYGKRTIMEILESIPVDPAQADGEAPSTTRPAGEDHDPSVEDL